MKKLICLLFALMILLTACAVKSKFDAEKEKAYADKPREESAQQELSAEQEKITPLCGVTAEEIEWVGYNDNSVPPGDYGTVYTDKEEIARILEMFAALEPVDEWIEEEAEEGNYCSYTVGMNDGSAQVVSRNGRNIFWDGKNYTGRLGRIPQKNDAELDLKKEWFEEGDARILEGTVEVFDPENTQIILPLTIKRMNEEKSRWEALEPAAEQENRAVKISEVDLTIELEREYKEVPYGDYKIEGTVILPTGEEKSVLAGFYIQQPEPPNCWPQSAPAAYFADDRVFEQALNSDRAGEDGHFPVFRFKDRAELQEFLQMNRDAFGMDERCGMVQSPQGEYCEADDVFFEYYDLVMVYTTSATGAERYEQYNMFFKDGKLTVYMDKHGVAKQNPGNGPKAWFFSIPLDKCAEEDLKMVDAVVEEQE